VRCHRQQDEASGRRGRTPALLLLIMANMDDCKVW
jgi:hypothetical protein